MYFWLERLWNHVLDENIQAKRDAPTLQLIPQQLQNIPKHSVVVHGVVCCVMCSSFTASCCLFHCSADSTTEWLCPFSLLFTHSLALLTSASFPPHCALWLKLISSTTYRHIYCLILDAGNVTPWCTFYLATSIQTLQIRYSISTHLSSM